MTPAEHAHRGIPATAVATDALLTAVDKLDDAAVREPSRLPGWTRAHLITHLARNADGLVNLLTWARTGVEHPMYTSRADRDAAIEEGAVRSYRLLAEDLAAACQRFAAAAEAMPDSAWSAMVAAPPGKPFRASYVPWRRVREVWIHLVDLAVGTEFDAIPTDIAADLLEDAVEKFQERDDVPAMTLHARLPGGAQRRFLLGGGTGPEIGGDAVDLVAWLTGRSSGTGLSGSLPALPPWG